MTKTKATGEVVRTTVDLPVALWRRAKFYTVEHRVDLREVIIAALEGYLKKEGSR